jgi:hypothetical protein
MDSALRASERRPVAHRDARARSRAGPVARLSPRTERRWITPVLVRPTRTQPPVGRDRHRLRRTRDQRRRRGAVLLGLLPQGRRRPLGLRAQPRQRRLGRTTGGDGRIQARSRTVARPRSEPTRHGKTKPETERVIRSTSASTMNARIREPSLRPENDRPSRSNSLAPESTPASRRYGVDRRDPAADAPRGGEHLARADVIQRPNPTLADPTPRRRFSRLRVERSTAC